MLGDSVVVSVRTRPQAKPLAVITMRKSIHAASFPSYMSMGRRSSIIKDVALILSKMMGVANFSSISACLAVSFF